MIIAAKIISYHTSAIITDYDDGSFEHFDATKMIIIKPDKYAGKEFYLYHQYDKEKSSFWQMKSAIVTFSLNESVDISQLDSSEIYSEGVDVYFIEMPTVKISKQTYKSSVFFEPNKTYFTYTHGGNAPIINHAGFNLTNQTKKTFSITIDKILFISNIHSVENPKVLEPTWIKIKLDDDTDIKQDADDKIKIESFEKIKADIFFKSFEYSTAAYDNTYVLFYITCNKRKYLVRSDINIIRKEPLNKK